MTNAKNYLHRLKKEIQELLGLLSVRELVVNQVMARRYELAHQQLIKWS